MLDQLPEGHLDLSHSSPQVVILLLNYGDLFFQHGRVWTGIDGNELADL